MTNSDGARRTAFFYPIPTQMNYILFCSPLYTLKSPVEFINIYVEMRHNIITSLKLGFNVTCLTTCDCSFFHLYHGLVRDV